LEWDFQKNGELTKNISAGSNRKVWWKCNKGHEWQAVICKRANRTDCPYCSNKKVLRGYNDLATIYPKLVNEWNYKKNSDLSPCDVVSGSNKKVWWKCDKGHEWKAEIQKRTLRGQGCPYCAGNILIKGKNDLATVLPELAIEWNYEKNHDAPCDYFSVSGKKVWWKCDKGHEWEAKISNRANGRKCPYCSNKKVLKGYNDLLTTSPDIIKEWNYEKNKGISPDSIVSGSNKKVWWKCEKGHEWEAVISDRFYGSRCPICNIESGTSFAEQAIYYYVKKVFKDAVNRYTDLGFELDIFIPAKMTGIEYDGRYYHFASSKVKKDISKNDKCRSNHIKLIRIQEQTNEAGLDADYYFERKKPYGDSPTIDECIKFIFEILGVKEKQCVIDSQSDRISIMEMYKNELYLNSLENKNPSLSKEWNYEKNGSLKPAMFSANSREKVWWRCGKGHEWEATIDNRSKGNGCPFCSGNRVLVGFNDLATISPGLAKEWNYNKNKDLTPYNVATRSNKKVWWVCNEGHEWEAVIRSRFKGSRCPYCLGQRVLLGENDLMTKNPELAKEWHPTKNRNLKPCDVMPNSNKKVWWICKKGHEWEAIIGSRNSGNGCPYCNNKKVLRGYNDLATTYPKLIEEWNFEKNENLSPYDVVYGSHKKVWWRCKYGHEWKAVIVNRTVKKYGCPFCSRKHGK